MKDKAPFKHFIDSDDIFDMRVSQREETVTTSTGVEESDEGFDLSSPIRNRESVFLHSPPLRVMYFFETANTKDSQSLNY